jgi:iron-sulfur cluster assembly accessory protein
MEKTQNITLTPEAAIAVKSLLKDQDLEGHSLRIFIAGVGWGGPQYGMSLDNQVGDSDEVYTSHGVQVIVDGQTLAYLQSATIKFVEENNRSGFLIEQTAPNAALSGGCAGCDPATGCG